MWKSNSVSEPHSPDKRQKYLLSTWLYEAQRSAGGDLGGDESGAKKDGEAVFADLAEFSGLLSGFAEGSAAPFDCCRLNLFAYNESVHFSKSTSRMQTESQLYLH